MYISYNLVYSIAKIIPFTIRSKQNLTFLQKYKKKSRPGTITDSRLAVLL